MGEPDRADIELTEATVVVARRTAASCDLDGETVLLELDSGLYHGLDGVGTRVWELLQEPRTVGAIRDVLVGEYEVDEETCRADLLSLLADMRRAGLVEARPGGS